jgi:hypothetical protein
MRSVSALLSDHPHPALNRATFRLFARSLVHLLQEFEHLGNQQVAGAEGVANLAQSALVQRRRFVIRLILEAARTFVDERRNALL